LPFDHSAIGIERGVLAARQRAFRRAGGAQGELGQLLAGLEIVGIV